MFVAAGCGTDGARALIVRAIDRYLQPGYDATRLELQKLVYFLKVAGAVIPRMDFHKQKYGPWSPSLEHVLEAMEGHFITGLGDGQVGARVTARPEAIVEASEVLHGAGANDGVYDQLAELIDGFETPFGMELSVLRIVTSDQAE